MIAINWFEGFLPEAPIEVWVEPPPPDGSPRTKQLPHRTLEVELEGQRTLLHLTTEQPATASIKSIDPATVPNVMKRLLEDGFARRAQLKGFDVRFSHVGGHAQVSTDWSLLPDIYVTLQGIRFRGFFFDGESGLQKRCGLILNWTTGQRFALTLEDPELRRLAIGKKVVPAERAGYSDREIPDSLRGASVLKEFKSGKGIVLGADGAESTHALASLTVPCSKQLLLQYVRQAKHPDMANRVSLKLQQDSLVLNDDRRVNTALARDQLRKLETLLTERELLTFELPLPGRTPVRLHNKPLAVGT